MKNQMDAIVELIRFAQESLLDLELSWCNMNLDNFIALSNCIKTNVQEDADSYNEGVRRGTIRKLNFSYNPFLARGERIQGPHFQNTDDLRGEDPNRKDSQLYPDLEGNDANEDKSCYEILQKEVEFDSESNSEDNDSAHDTFVHAFISLVKSQSMTTLTHLDLSGIGALGPDDSLELMNELFDYQHCENLLSVHLNDLGLNFNSRIKDDMMELFRIQTSKEQYITGNGNLYAAFSVFIEKVRGGMKYRRENAQNFGYLKVIKQALGYPDPDAPLDKSHNFVLAQQLQLLGEQRTLMRAGHLSPINGIGTSSHLGSQMDRFILSRKSNLVPELMFN